MTNHFFDHLTLIDEVVTEIDLHELDPEQRKELVEIALKTIRHQSLATILDHLPRDKHEHFLTKYHNDPASKELLTWIKEEIKDDIEDKIKTEANRIKKEILAEIKKSSRK